jgi:hypothetical protein
MSAPSPAEAAIYELTPFVHVADVHASVRFYEQLGFTVSGSIGHEDHLHWAWLTTGGANLMLASADGPIDGTAQGVLFYLYTHDLAALRSLLVSRGIAAGEIAYPEHLPAGELRLVDPDGYELMLGQRSAT